MNDLAFETREPKPFVPFTEKEIDEWDAFRNKIKGHLNEQDGIDCPLCNNKGHYFKHDTYYMCDCLKRRVAIQKIKSSGLDLTKTFDNYNTTYDWQIRIKNDALAYAKNPIGWFFIGGQSGSGKTHICNAICIELMKTRNIKYLTWRLGSQRLKMQMKEEDYFEKLDDILNAEYLYIDDLFKGGITDADLSLAWTILDWRASHRLPTIISSEKTSDEIWNKDQSLGGRIEEMCDYGKWYPFNLVGEDKNQRRRK